MDKNDFLKFHRAWVEIDLDTLRSNLSLLTKEIPEDSGSKPMCVVKANGYGHDDITVMNCLEECGVDWFAVSSIDEAIRLRNGGCSGEILILGYTPADAVDELVKYDIIAAAISKEHAYRMNREAKRRKLRIRVHAAIDTGMGRIGVIADDIDRCIEETADIFSMSNLKAEGLFTHYSSADNDDSESIKYTKMQTEKFLAVKKGLEEKGFSPKVCHFLNSAGGLYHFDPESSLIRYGISLYGLKPNAEIKSPVPVKPVLSFKTVISYIKDAQPGDCISYGRTFTVSKPMKIATIPAGYADGYSRLLSNKAEVLIGGKRCRILGNVCMDQMMVDISDVPDAKCGDEAILIGSQGSESITADDLAQLYGTIGYEIICGIGMRVPRVIIENGEIRNVLTYINL